MSSKNIAFWTFVSSHAYFFVVTIIFTISTRYVDVNYEYPLMAKLAFFSASIAALTAFLSMIVFFALKKDINYAYGKRKLATAITLLTFDGLIILGYLVLGFLYYIAFNSL